MKVTSDRAETIYRHDKEDRTIYTMKLVKKNMDGEYENGYILTKFRNGVELDDKSKIKIKDAWLDFYKKDDKTNISLFVNDFDLEDNNTLQNQEANMQENASYKKQDASMPEENPFANVNSKNGIKQPIQYTDEDLPF